MPKRTPSDRPTTSSAALRRQLRQVYAAVFAISAGILPAYAWRGRGQHAAWPAAVLQTQMIVAAGAALSGMALWMWLARPAIQKIRAEGDRPDLLGHLRQGSILLLIGAETCVVFGVRLYLHGASAAQAAFFWLLGLALEIAFWPRRWVEGG